MWRPKVAVARRVPLAPHRLVIEPIENINAYGLGWYECTAPAARLLLSRKPATIKIGWILLRLTVVRPSRPLQLVAHVPALSALGMTESIVLAEADGRHVQGLMYISDSMSELLIEIRGGPAQLQIKKAIIRELGWLPLHRNKVVQRLLEKTFIARLPVPSPVQDKPKARSIQQENRRQDYGRWIELFDTLGPDDVDAIKEDIKCLGYHPRFSIVVPIYNIDVEFLCE